MGVIDVDVYGVSYSDTLKLIEKEKLPLIACRSKSGGLHLFMFMADPVEAELLQTRLKEIAVALGFGESEIFPKQKHIDLGRGDLGSWLNMPYFRGDETDRYAFRDQSGIAAMTLEEFVEAAERVRLTAAQLRSIGKSAGLPATAREAEEKLHYHAEVLSALTDGRDRYLTMAAFDMGRYIGADLVDRELVERTLTSAARAAGMDERDIADILPRQIAAGIAKGRKPAAKRKTGIPDSSTPRGRYTATHPVALAEPLRYGQGVADCGASRPRQVAAGDVHRGDRVARRSVAGG